MSPTIVRKLYLSLQVRIIVAGQFTYDYVLENFQKPRNRRIRTNDRGEYNFHHDGMRSKFYGMVRTSRVLGYNAECECSCKNNNEDYLAWVRYFGNTIHFCPDFFQSDAEEQAKTIMHELSHLAGVTGDYKVLKWFRKGRWGLAHNDADYYELFYNNPPLKTEMVWVWQLIFPEN